MEKVPFWSIIKTCQGYKQIESTGNSTEAREEKVN